MPGKTGERLTISVGKREFENLSKAWAAYTEATESRTAPIDPVIAMQRTGTVLRSLKAVITTLGVASANPEKSCPSGEG